MPQVVFRIYYMGGTAMMKNGDGIHFGGEDCDSFCSNVSL